MNALLAATLLRLRRVYRGLTPRRYYMVMGAITAAHVVFVFAFKTHPGVDGDTYQLMARRIISSGDILACGALDNAYWPPLFCYYLAALYGLFGQASAFYFLGNVVIALIAAEISRRYLEHVFGELTGRWASALFFASMLVFYFTLYYKYELLTALLLAIGFAFVFGRSSVTSFRALAAGCALGLAALATARVVSLFPAILLVLLYGRPHIPSRRKLAVALVFVAGFAVVIAPWTIRNYLCMGKFIPITNNSGINFYMGFNPLADGSYREAGEMLPPYNTVPLTDNATFYRGGWEFICSFPADAARLMLKKIVILWRVHYLDSVLFYPFFYLGVLIAGRLVPPEKRMFVRSIQLAILSYTAFHMLFIARYYYVLPLLPVVYGMAVSCQRFVGSKMLARYAPASA